MIRSLDLLASIPQLIRAPSEVVAQFSVDSKNTELMEFVELLVMIWLITFAAMINFTMLKILLPLVIPPLLVLLPPQHRQLQLQQMLRLKLADLILVSLDGLAAVM